MIGKKMSVALNKQINAEFYSAYLYLAMSAQCTALGLKGAASWFGVQYKEETTHALKIFEYLNQQSAPIGLTAIDEPPAKFKSLLQMMEESLKHERKVTGLIHELMSLALAEKDHATASFLKWFVDEQVEEEENVQDILNVLHGYGDCGCGLMVLDKELGERKFAEE